MNASRHGHAWEEIHRKQRTNSQLSVEELRILVEHENIPQPGDGKQRGLGLLIILATFVLTSTGLGFLVRLIMSRF